VNLGEIRRQFVNESGRHDLVVDTEGYADNGANFYINAGQRLLDRLDQVPKNSARVFKLAAAGDYGVTFPSCRAVQEVWIGDTSSRGKIEKISMQELRSFYYDRPMEQIARSLPLKWAPIWARTIPDRIVFASIDALTGYVDVPVDVPTRQIYNGVLWMPPAEKQYQVEVVGMFYTADLTEDSHVSYWTEVHPELLVLGALAVLETTYRNRQGLSDAMAAISLFIEKIGFDTVDEEIADMDELEG
jgi:hypothetical protein